VTSKAAALADAVSVNEATASVDTFDTTTGSTTTTTTGSGYALSTNVDGISGSAGNDTISGIIAASGTFTIGDDIFGGSGTDTLNLIALDHETDSVFASINGVEVVNIRQLGTAANALVMNAVNWSGVASLSNASSLAATTLTVTGVEVATNIRLEGNTDINVAFRNSTTAGPVGITLVGAGSADGASTLASATANGTAHIDLDQPDTGLISGVAVTLSGTNLARLEAGSNVLSYTINGSGNSILVTDDTITSFNAASAQGDLDVTFSGVSEVTVVGGAGNDTFRLGTGLSNSDSVNGGSGTDTVHVTIGGFNRNLVTSNVESAVVTFSEAVGGTLNASASTVSNFTLAAGTAGNAASLEAVGGGATITLSDDDLGDVTLDYASGAVSTTLNLGSASGAVALGTLSITDAANVSINAVGVSGSVGGSIGTASFDSDLKSLTIATSGGEADLTIGTDNVDMQLGGATSLTVTSNGSAGITFNAVDLAGTALTTVSVNARSDDAADISLGDVSGQAISTINLSGTSGADVTVGTLDLGDSASATARSITLAIVQGQTSNVTVGAITVNGQGTFNLNVTQSGTAIADVGTITVVKTGTADAAAQNLTFGAVSVAASGEVGINAIAVGSGTGAQLTFGSIVVGQDGGYSAGNITVSAALLDVDVSSVSLTVGASATATFGNIVENSGGAVGNVLVTLGSEATATFGTVTASAIGTHTIVAATGASANFGNMTAEQTVGAIEISGVDGADVQFGAIGASAVGAIAASGALNVTIGRVVATTIGEVNATNLGVSGQFSIDLSGVTNAIEVKLGAATNTVVSGVGNDVFTLRSGTTGNDNIQYTTATQGQDNLINFFAGSTGADQIEFDVSEFVAAIRDADGSAVAAAATTDVMIASSATSLADTDNVLILTSAYASTAGMITDLVSGVTFATALRGSGNLVVVFTDGSDSHVGLLSFSASANNADTKLATALAAGEVTFTTLATLSGVSAGAVAAANFAFV
jgi:hypothetical protein